MAGGAQEAVVCSGTGDMAFQERSSSLVHLKPVGHLGLESGGLGIFQARGITGTNLAWNAKSVDIRCNELTQQDIRRRLVVYLTSI